MTTLILGGTTEASRLAAAMAERGLPAILSYAGRTEAPRLQPVPIRIGGFGGGPGDWRIGCGRTGFRGSWMQPIPLPHRSAATP